MTKKPKSAGRSASEREKPETPPPTRKIDRVLNCLPSKKTENDWTIANLGDDAVSLATPLPKKVDLRADWCVSAWNFDPLRGVIGVQF